MVKCDWCKSPEHIELLENLCEHDPETQRQHKLIAEFFKVYPGILGLAYEAADVLRRERNIKIQKAAINAVTEEIAKRPKSGDANYSITRRRVTEDQVRGILKEQRILIEGTDIQREKLVRKNEAEEKERDAIYTCPFFLNLPEEEKTNYRCHGSLLIKSIKRDKIVSLRVAEGLDNALSYLAKQLDVPRSLLVSEILAMKGKFPEASL